MLRDSLELCGVSAQNQGPLRHVGQGTLLHTAGAPGHCLSAQCQQDPQNSPRGLFLALDGFKTRGWMTACLRGAVGDSSNGQAEGAFYLTFFSHPETLCFQRWEVPLCGFYLCSTLCSVLFIPNLIQPSKLPYQSNIIILYFQRTKLKLRG